jgi:hypothetical protein
MAIFGMPSPLSPLYVKPWKVLRIRLDLTSSYVRSEGSMKITAILLAELNR